MTLDQKFISAQLISFLYEADRATYDQISDILAYIQTLQSVLFKNLSPKQINELRELEKSAEQAMFQIVSRRSISVNVIKLLYDPENLVWEDIDLNTLVENTAKHLETSLDTFKYKQHNANNEQIPVKSILSLLANVVEHFLRIGYLLSASEPIIYSITESKNEVVISLQGSTFSTENDDERTGTLYRYSQAVVQRIILIFGGYCNWNEGENIRSLNKLEICFPKVSQLFLAAEK